MLATLEIALRTLVESSVIAVITASVITASTTPYSAIVWPSSRLRSSAAAAVYACAKAKSFNKGFTSPRAFSGACLLNGWFEGGAATTPDSSVRLAWPRRPGCGTWPDHRPDGGRRDPSRERLIVKGSRSLRSRPNEQGSVRLRGQQRPVRDGGAAVPAGRKRPPRGALRRLQPRSGSTSSGARGAGRDRHRRL